jgi:hypothetical protein
MISQSVATNAQAVEIAIEGVFAVMLTLLVSHAIIIAQPGEVSMVRMV